MSQESMELVRSGIEAFNRRDVDAILAVTDPDVEWIEDARYPGAETFHGPAGVERSVRKWWDAWEIEVDPEEFIDLGHHIVVVGHTHARGHGSDVTLTAEFGTVYEVRNDRIVRAEVLGSREEALEAVGLRE